MLKDGEKGVIRQRSREIETYAIAPHIPCGIINPGQLRKLADVAEKYEVSALKITSAARIALVGIKEEQVDEIWKELGMDAGIRCHVERLSGVLLGFGILPRSHLAERQKHQGLPRDILLQAGPAGQH